MKNITRKQQYNIIWALKIYAELGFIIAVPASALAFLGSLADKKYHISPWGVIFGLVIALIISSTVVWKMIKKLEK